MKLVIIIHILISINNDLPSQYAVMRFYELSKLEYFKELYHYIFNKNLELGNMNKKIIPVKE